MFNQFTLGREFFATLEALDDTIARRVAADRCPECGGPLHRGDYRRKPRGGLIAAAGEEFVLRYSLCCGSEGCRKRSTPPSLRFLGRRVYLGAVVFVASVMAQALAQAAEILRATGVPARTTRRWLGWWRGPFLGTDVLLAIRARLVGVAVERLPASLLERLPGPLAGRVRAMLELLAPITTGSVRDGARFMRDLV